MSCHIFHKCNFWSSHWPLLGILVLTVITFWPTFSNGFQMEWDDQWQVLNSYTSGGLSLAELRISFTRGISGQYDPLNQLMYSLLWRIDGYNSMIFHAACLFLHLTNVYCIFALVRTIVEDCTSLKSDRIQWIVVVTTIFFAIHPLQVESVAWISASKIVMSTLFYLLAGMSLIHFIKEGGFVRYTLVFVFMLFSYFSKETAVTFPLWATLLCLWYGLSPHENRFWRILIPIYLAALLLGCHAIFVVTSYHRYLGEGTFIWWQRIVYCFYSIVTYLFKWLFPLNLSWMYRYPTPLGESLPSWLLSYPLLFSILIYALWERIRHPYISSALMFSLIHLLFVLHLIVLPREAVVADRYMYLPLVGLNFIFAYVLTSPLILRSYRKGVFSAVLLLVVVSSCLAYSRTKDWVDSSTLKKEKVIDNK